MKKMNRIKLRKMLDDNNIKVSQNLFENLLKIYNKQPGSYFSIIFENNLKKYVSRPLQDKYTVTKMTKMSVRALIDYNNLQSTINKRMEQGYTPSMRTPWFHHIDKLLLKHNKEDKFYVMLFPNNGKTHSVYRVNGDVKTKEELKNMGIMINSYWKEEKHEVFTEHLENIYEVF